MVCFVEVESLEKPHSVVIALDDNVAEAFRGSLPFESVAVAWKQEVYLSTPVQLDLRGAGLSANVVRGFAYYWPPERSLCLFYGVTHAYTPVARVGVIVDPVQRVPGLAGEFREQCGVRVKEHVIDEGLRDVAEVLRSRGYLVATPLDDGVRVITACKLMDAYPHRSAATVYVEDYGAHVEGETLGVFNNGLSDVALFNVMAEAVSKCSRRYARLDLTEEGYVAVTAGVGSLSELAEAVDEVIQAQACAYRELLRVPLKRAV